MSTKWFPIEDCPEATWVWLADHNQAVKARFDRAGHYETAVGFKPLAFKPTHYRPLDTLPARPPLVSDVDFIRLAASYNLDLREHKILYAREVIALHEAKRLVAQEAKP